MLRFSKKVEYALIAMLHMSKKSPGELTTARELSGQFNISLELIGKILQNLARNSLIISTQGVKGGYQLQRSPAKININTIINAVEGPIRLTKCAEKISSDDCERKESCIIKEQIGNIQLKLIDLFDKISLKEFERKYRKN